MSYDPTSPAEYAYKHMTEISTIINKLQDHMPGSAEEKDIIYDMLCDFYDSIKTHIEIVQKLNYLAIRLHEIHEEEKTNETIRETYPTNN